MAEQKRIVVTGVSRGLGHALVERFIEAGHLVAGCARSAEAVETLQARWAAPHWFAVVDVAREEQVRDWASVTLEQFGVPDLLVNNAAVINENAPLWEVSAEDFSNIVDVNIKGVASVIRHFVPAMLPAAEGVIVNFSSTWGRYTSPEVAPYCTTKFAIEGLTRALSQELPTGMAAVAFNPGVINTQMLQVCFGASANAYPSPAAWAETAAPYLLSLGTQQNGKSVTAPG